MNVRVLTMHTALPFGREWVGNGLEEEGNVHNTRSEEEDEKEKEKE